MNSKASRFCLTALGSAFWLTLCLPATAQEQPNENRNSSKAEVENGNASRQQPVQQDSQPPRFEDAELKVFRLKYNRAEQLIQTLSTIVGDIGLRVGADEQSNSLVVAGDNDGVKIVEELLRNLDQPADRNRADETTLQLRLVWLIDGVDGLAPAVGIDTGSSESEGIVNPQVVDALALLGFSDPKVVCQQATTITLSNEGGNGEFGFDVPVLINGKLWKLDGNGHVRATTQARFTANLDIDYAPSTGSDRDASHRGRLAGAIYTPLRHFTVMGTTTFVEPPEVNPDGNVGRQSQQYLSAFVVFLDRAEGFAANIRRDGDR